jgi:formate dehydrogenase maturation protein FdhE
VHPPLPDRPPGPSRRAEPREVVELKTLKVAQPELGPAIDMQLALLGLQKRILSRVPIPTCRIDQGRMRRHIEERRPLLAFGEIPLDWTDLRLMARQTLDILRRFDSIDQESCAALQAIARQPQAFQEVVERWYNSAALGQTTDASVAPGSNEMLDQVLTLAMRPFLARCAETILPQLDLGGWRMPRCPLCGGEPEFAVVTPAGERMLLCGRCTGAWPFEPFTCPFCGNDDSARITSFTSRDGQYRLYACDSCRRYLKAFDARHATRTALLAVDTIATLPLDAAAIQKGYQG